MLKLIVQRNYQFMLESNGLEHFTGKYDNSRKICNLIQWSKLAPSTCASFSVQKREDDHLNTYSKMGETASTTHQVLHIQL